MQSPNNVIYLNYFKKIKISRIIINFIYYTIAAILVFSGLIKIIDPLPLLETIKLFPFVPDTLHLILVTMLPIVEIGLGVMMFFKPAGRAGWIKQTVTLSAVMILFFFFFVFSLYGTFSGLENDCGCFGSVIKSEFGWGMIFRNMFFFGLSIFLYIKRRA